MTRLQIQGQPGLLDDQPVRITGALDFVLETPSSSSVVLGATAEPASTAGMLAVLGEDCKYTRDYGKSSGAIITPHGEGKLALMPAGSVVHVSIKGDVSQFGSWLDSAPGHLRYHVTWYHEPVDNMDAATYIASASLLPAIINASPMRHLVLGNGPCLTRWNLQSAGFDPALWMYPGATHLYADTYNQNTTRYLTAAEQFGVIAEAARALGVRWGVPEYGMSLLASDADGSARAAAITAHYEWLALQPDLDCVGWWDIGGCRLTNRTGAPDLASLVTALGKA